MIQWIAFLYLISVMIAIADGSRCLVGHSRNADECNEISVSSLVDSKCIVISEYHKLYGKEYHSVLKAFVGQWPCDTMIYAYTEQAGVMLSFKCCSGDNCNTNNYEMTPDNGERKGKSCPSCLEHNLEECTSEKEIICKEIEDRCTEYIGTIMEPDGGLTNYSVKGCASPFACKMGFGDMIGLTEISRVQFKCD